MSREERRMAKVRDNPITMGLSGKLDKRLFFRRIWNGSTLLCTVPDFSNRVFSTGQLTHQSRFQRAAAYAKVAAKTHPVYAELAWEALQPAYNFAWFPSPIIHNIRRNMHLQPTGRSWSKEKTWQAMSRAVKASSGLNRQNLRVSIFIP